MITQTEKIIIFTFATSGMFFLVLGAIGATFWRKKEVSLLKLFCAGSAVRGHSEKYVRQDRVKVVKVLNLVGAFLFLMGVLVMVGYSIWK
jgi:hypothetical protein